MLEQGDLPESALTILDLESADGVFDLSVILFYPKLGAARELPGFDEYVSHLGYFEFWQARGAPDICRAEPGIPLCARLSP